ncbi:MAG: hypothetical protein Q8K65_03995 [Alphaproteobacteria bacterium]|nr:hypothetical protein [Alphaproteobacteria bacterium]
MIKQWTDTLREKLLGAFGRTAPPPPPAAPAPPELTPEQKIKQNPLWGKLMFDVMAEGRAEPDPDVKHRVRVIGVRPKYRIHQTVPCDIVTLKLGDDTAELRAKPGGSVFVAKAVDWERDGQPRRTTVYTHISTETHKYIFDIRDASGTSYPDAARPQKIIDLMAAMQQRGADQGSRYEGLGALAQELGLRVPETPAAITRPAAPPEKGIEVLKPAAIRRRTTADIPSNG